MEEDLITILVRPVITQINHRPAMSMSAPCIGRGPGRFRLVAPPGRVRKIANIVLMIRNRFDIIVRVRIEVLATLSMVASTLDHMPQMRNHAGRDKSLPLVIEVDTPRIAGAIHESFKDVLLRMISPDCSVERKSSLIGVTRLAYFGMREHAMTSVEPSIWSPNKRVQRFMSILPAKPIAKNDRSRGHVFGEL